VYSTSPPLAGKKRENKFMIARRLPQIAGIILIVVTLLSMSCAGTAPKRKTYSAPPPMTIDTSKQYAATIETDWNEHSSSFLQIDYLQTISLLCIIKKVVSVKGVAYFFVLPQVYSSIG